MLGHVVARNPAPMLAMRHIGLRLRRGPVALGNALGDSIAGAASRPSYTAEEMAGDYARENNRFAAAAARAADEQEAARIDAGSSQRSGLPSFLDSVRRVPGFGDAAFGDGDGWEMLPTGGGSSSARYRAGSLTELARRDAARGGGFEMARNEGRDALFNGADDFTGFVGLMGDYRVLGNVMTAGAQMDRMQAELSDIRKDLLALGKKPPLDGVPDMYAPGDGARVVADKLTEYRNYARLAAYEQGGVLTLNEDLSIRTIGKDKLSPEAFVAQLGRVYEAGVSEGAAIAKQRLDEGKLFVNYLKFGDQAELIAQGNSVDKFSKGAAGLWVASQGVPEGAYGLVSFNRRYSDVGDPERYRMPDLLVNFGPRAVLALDATLGTKTAATPQVRDSLRYGVTDWVNVTPRGSQWISNSTVTPTYRWRK